MVLAQARIEATFTDGILPRIIRARITEGVNEIGLLTFEVPAEDLPGGPGDVTAVNFSREGEGLIFPGHLRKASSSLSDAGAAVSTIEVWGREIELAWAETYRGVVVVEETTQAVFDLLLAGTGWTGTLEGSGFPTHLRGRRYDNMTVFQALRSFSETIGGYMRFDRINRVVTISNDPPDTGIVVETGAPAFGDVGVLSSITALTEDRSELINRIVPESKVDGNEVFSLALSNRSSPYTRQTFVPTRPHVTRYGGGSAEVGDFWPRAVLDVIPPIDASGVNRYMIAFLHCKAGTVEGLDVIGAPNDMRMTPPVQQSQSDIQTLSAWWAGGQISVASVPETVAIIRPGSNTWKFGHNLTSTNVWMHAFAITLQDCRIQGTSASPQLELPVVGTGSFSNFSLTPGVGFANALWLEVIAYIGSGTPTATSGQEVLHNEEIVLSGTQNLTMAVAVKPVTPGVSNTLNWTFPGSRPFRRLIWRIHGALATYIEDSASVTKYGLRSVTRSMGDYRTDLAPVGLQAAANTMYDAAAAILTESKDPRMTYAGEVAWLPQGPLDWEVGSTMRVRNTLAALPFDEELVAPKRTQDFDASGARTWSLEWSTRNHFRSSELGVIERMIESIGALETAQA